MPNELWGQHKDTGDEDDTFIEFSARGEQKPENTAHKTMKSLPENEILQTEPNKEPENVNSTRGGWGNDLDFLFSCISVSVGLGNVWRFPYLCYKNGGGAFLITYMIAMMTCGIPLFFQEVAVGQYLGTGGMTLVGQLCPILQGVGYATMTIVFFLDIYYCVIIAWTIFYLLATFSRIPDLPWQHCGNWWNTEHCFDGGLQTNDSSQYFYRNNSFNHTTTPVEEYFDKRVLQITSGIEELGGLQWELLGCLALGWLLVYFIVCRGLHQSGKVIWFTALFPYLVLAVLLVRSVTLPGASDGLLYYITPRWHELLGPGPWIDGATQIFFAYSIGTGALPALGSYNSFHHNSYKDAVITCIVNTATCLLAGCVTFSILGHIALEQHEDVANVVKSGPGLVFLTYPEVVLKLPGAPAWAAIFFIMLVILGIDSEFCIVESLVIGLIDRWPSQLTQHRGKFTFAMCVLLFLLGIPMVTHGGAYIFQLMDFYAVSGMSLLWVCFFQTIAISWIFGVNRFADCVKEMMGVQLGAFWRICWVAVAPFVMMSIFIFYVIKYTPVTYGQSYHYPEWAQIVGLCLSFTSMLWIPCYAIYYILTGSGTLKENLIKGLQSNIKSRNNISSSQSQAIISMSESSAKLIIKNNSFLSSR